MLTVRGIITLLVLVVLFALAVSGSPSTAAGRTRAAAATVPPATSAARTPSPAQNRTDVKRPLPFYKAQGLLLYLSRASRRKISICGVTLFYPCGRTAGGASRYGSPPHPAGRRPRQAGIHHIPRQEGQSHPLFHQTAEQGRIPHLNVGVQGQLARRQQLFQRVPVAHPPARSAGIPARPDQPGPAPAGLPEDAPPGPESSRVPAHPGPPHKPGQ